MIRLIWIKFNGMKASEKEKKELKEHSQYLL